MEEWLSPPPRAGQGRVMTSEPKSGPWQLSSPLMSYPYHQIVSSNQEFHCGPLFLIVWKCHLKRFTSRQKNFQRLLSQPGLCLLFYLQASSYLSPLPTHHQVIDLRWPPSTPYPWLPTKQLVITPPDSIYLPSPGSYFQQAHPRWRTIFLCSHCILMLCNCWSTFSTRFSICWEQTLLSYCHTQYTGQLVGMMGFILFHE